MTWTYRYSVVQVSAAVSSASRTLTLLDFYDILITNSRSPPLVAPPAFKFPLSNDAQLQVPMLNVLRAFSVIATAFDLEEHMWERDYLHVLQPGRAPHLPLNLQPTPAQLYIPHHPYLDLLPWPSIREKLICILSMPSKLRPPIAQEGDPLETGQAAAVWKLMEDVDDEQEGLRVYGHKVGWDTSNELLEESWDVGECFYRNWGFCISPKTVAASNRWRRERGLPTLKFGK